MCCLLLQLDLHSYRLNVITGNGVTIYVYLVCLASMYILIRFMPLNDIISSFKKVCGGHQGCPRSNYSQLL